MSSDMHKNNISSFTSILVSFSGVIILPFFLIRPTLNPVGRSASSIDLLISLEVFNTFAWIISAWVVTIA